MTDQLVIKAITSHFNRRVMDEIRVTKETTMEFMAAKFRTWNELGWTHDWTVEQIPDGAGDDISDIRGVVIPFPLDLAYSRRR